MTSDLHPKRPWETVVILKTNEAIKDKFHGVRCDGFTRCGRKVSVGTVPNWRWKLDDAVWAEPCARCFPNG